MRNETLSSPSEFLRNQLGELPLTPELHAYERWWEQKGKFISEGIDRSGTPWLRMFDRFGARHDEVLLAPEYRELLLEGYRRGILWQTFAQNSLLPFYLLGYTTAFYDTGLYCPYTVSLGTAVPIHKYAGRGLKERYLTQMLRRDEGVWQGATWMTEIKGGSDLAANVETSAAPKGRHWILNGDKYFASNVGAELAVVAARLADAPKGVRGLALFLVPRLRKDGSLNYQIRRLKNKIATRSVPTGEVELRASEAWLLGKAEWGIYQILEVLNLSRVANAMGSVALAQRAINEALIFARGRSAFGKPIIEHPLLRKQFKEKQEGLQEALALAWEAVRLLNRVWLEKPPYSEQYHLLRLVAHLAKYWTAEFAVQSAKWSMEVHGGIGTLGEYPVERWLREAMILAIWEGTPHRQILDGLEVMQRKGAHKLLLQYLAPLLDTKVLSEWNLRIERHLQLPQAEVEAGGEELFRELARFTARSLLADSSNRNFVNHNSG